MIGVELEKGAMSRKRLGTTDLGSSSPSHPRATTNNSITTRKKLSKVNMILIRLAVLCGLVAIAMSDGRKMQKPDGKDDVQLSGPGRSGGYRNSGMGHQTGSGIEMQRRAGPGRGDSDDDDDDDSRRPGPFRRFPNHGQGGQRRPGQGGRGMQNRQGPGSFGDHPSQSRPGQGGRGMQNRQSPGSFGVHPGDRSRPGQIGGMQNRQSPGSRGGRPAARSRPRQGGRGMQNAVSFTIP